MNKLVKDVMTRRVAYAKREATFKALAARTCSPTPGCPSSSITRTEWSR